jgi:hypothetical protein
MILAEPEAPLRRRALGYARGMGRLVRRVLEGYEDVAEWSPDDPSSIEAAQLRLRDELAAGYMAVIADGDDNQPVTELPANADMVILTMPMGGG